MKLIAKNLPLELNAAQLEMLFSKFGKVENSKVIYDRVTSESRGFGFVTMEQEEEGKKAIEALHEKELMGNVITVEEAVDQKKFKIRF